jgi:pyruvate ferredoxin oxidoreductase gamma subunit
MIEYRIHGRGGQGSVAAAYLLAAAAFEAGHTCQAFPAFGAERRGAPVTAFVRIDDKPIHLRSQVAAPDYLIVQDETLLLDRNLTHGLKPGGAMLVNSRKPAEGIAKAFNTRVVAIPATEMAVEEIGRPIPNTALLAAFLALTGHLPQEALAAALKGRFHGPVLEKNLKLIARAAEAVEAGAWKKEGAHA